MPRAFLAASAAAVFLATPVLAAEVKFDAPASVSVTVGSSFTVSGAANPDFVGTGLDLMLVLDSSGSMRSNTGFDIDGNGTNDTRRFVQAYAAKELVDSLPTDTGTRVGVVDFDGGASVVQSLTQTTPTANIDAIKATIDNINSSGGTNFTRGINAAVGELTANGSATSNKEIVFISDGTASSATAAAQAAKDAGFRINTIGLPGASSTQLQDIATTAGGSYFDASTDLNSLISLFSGAGGSGSLAGITGIKITNPDGSTYDALVSGFGSFTGNAYTIGAGANVFTAFATFDNGATASAMLTINGVTDAPQVPLPAGLPLILTGLGALAVMRRKS